MFLETVIQPGSRTIPSKQHLLLVDDEPVIRALAKLELEREGYRVTTASNADEALLSITNLSISLVILDLNLRNIDGLALLKVIKKRYRTLPVVILTGARFDEETVQEAMRIGANGFISKGVEIDELISEICRIFR